MKSVFEGVSENFFASDSEGCQVRLVKLSVDLEEGSELVAEETPGAVEAELLFVELATVL